MNYSSKVKFIGLVLIISDILYSQNNNTESKYFYYYQKQRIYLQPAVDEIYVTFVKDTQEQEIKEVLNRHAELQTVRDESISVYHKSIRFKIRKSRADDKVQTFMANIRSEKIVSSVYPVFYKDGGRIMIDNEIMYKLRPTDDESLVNAFLKPYNPTLIEKLDVSFRYYKVFVSIGKEYDPLEVSNALNNSGLVEFSAPNFTIECQNEDFTPNDPLYGQQWFLTKIGAHVVWDIQRGRTEIIVAVIDGNGYDLGHPEFSGKCVGPYNAVDNNNDPSPENSCSKHGTPCAGLIAALTNNGVGVASVGFNVKVMPIRIGYNAQCNGSYSTTSLIISRAESWIVTTNANQYIVTVSNSWSVAGGPYYWLEDSYRNIHNNSRRPFGTPLGAVVLFSSGNNSSSTVGYPASMNAGFEVIAVGATDQSDRRAGYSNYGTALDIVAPGEDCLTLDIRGSGGYCNPGDYCNFSGTSAACPIAAGVIGLIGSQNRSLNVSEYERYLLQYAAKVGGYTYSGNYQYGTKNIEMGYGRVDAYASVSHVDPYLTDDLCLNGPAQLTGTRTYEAIHNLQASCNGYLVEVVGNITFKAGNSIILSPPFSVADNATFAAFITPLDYTEGRHAYNNSTSFGNSSYNTLRDNSRAQDGQLPVDFSLSQNYPNPFNSSTLIKYALKENVSVKITIYDILGRMVRTLVNEYQDAGFKSVIWNGANDNSLAVSSGMYIYKIEAGDFVGSKKMLLIK